MGTVLASEMAAALLALGDQAVSTPPVRGCARLRLSAHHDEHHDAGATQPFNEFGVTSERDHGHVNPLLDTDIDMTGANERHEQIDRNCPPGQCPQLVRRGHNTGLGSPCCTALFRVAHPTADPKPGGR